MAVAANEGRAGGSARRHFAQARRRAVWEYRPDWIQAVLLGLALLAFVPFTDGTAQLLVVATCGFLAGAFVILWQVGDVRALPFLWGSIGEEQTAALLRELGDGWTVEHDKRRRNGGNWDHIVAGPPGAFLLDSKNLTQPGSVVGDALGSGRTRYGGDAMRGAAAELAATRREWVQPLVVVWGEFAQRCVESHGVVYIAAKDLVPWLRSRSLRTRAARA
jgi:hypothetical protein